MEKLDWYYIEVYYNKGSKGPCASLIGPLASREEAETRAREGVATGAWASAEVTERFESAESQ